MGAVQQIEKVAGKLVKAAPELVGPMAVEPELVSLLGPVEVEHVGEVLVGLGESVFEQLVAP